MNNRIINRLTYKSGRNVKMVFEILENEGENLFFIHIYNLLSIDTPNLIESKILKIFRDVVLVRDSVLLKRETFEQILYYFTLFKDGKLPLYTYCKAIKQGSL